MKNLFFLYTIFAPLILYAQWTEVEPPSPWVYNFHNVKFYGTVEGFLFSENGYLHHTEDSGNTWTIVNFPSWSQPMRDVFHFEPFTIIGLAAPEPPPYVFYLFQASRYNGLEAWLPVNDTLSGVTSACFLNVDFGFCGVLKDTLSCIYKLGSFGPDAPLTKVWQWENSFNYVVEVNHIICLNEQIVVATYGIPNPYYYFLQEQGELIRSNDQGETWAIKASFNDENYFTKLDLSLDGTCLYAITPEFIFYSTDNGETWEQQSIQLLTAEMLSRQEGYGVIQTLGGSTMIDTLSLVFTEDAWQTWDVQYQLPLDEMPTFHNANIFMINEMVGWATIDLKLLKTENGGFVGIHDNNMVRTGKLAIQFRKMDENISVEWPEGLICTQIKLFDIMSQIMYSSQLSGMDNYEIIRLPKLKSGIYVVCLLENDLVAASGKVFLY